MYQQLHVCTCSLTQGYINDHDAGDNDDARIPYRRALPVLDDLQKYEWMFCGE